jgi:murein DD-endopeptidase MepM/ murein hydrolase activator NlpD
MRVNPDLYQVKPGDTLVKIAGRFFVGVESIIEKNNIENPNIISVGEQFEIPAPAADGTAPDQKIIPDSELVNGPMNLFFDPESNFDPGSPLYLYKEDINDREFSAVQVINKVSVENSVNPRLLLAILEYQSGWLSASTTITHGDPNPFRIADLSRASFYHQASWIANTLNRGYYLSQLNAFPNWVLADGTLIKLSPSTNPGTNAIQYLMSHLYGNELWEKSIGPEGILATYETLFGYPFDHAIEPQIPLKLSQPVLQLPFEPGIPWSFTGGPHPGWGDGSAWAGLDFAPPSESVGCVPSDEWVTAAADGVIAYADEGVILLDLDGDGYFQTGWVIQYLHIDSRDRIELSEIVRAGQRLGHPSCEGGISSGTHIHIARLYNGEWISADGDVPFTLDGWVSSGLGSIYDGELTRNGIAIEAWNGRRDENQIQR